MRRTRCYPRGLESSYPVERAAPPFFLVGNPRSGTKMLRELLNRSPDIWISDIESHFIPHFTRTQGRFGDLRERGAFDRLVAALEGTRAFWYWRTRGIQLDADLWWSRCRTRDWPGVLEALFHCVHEQEIPNPPQPWEAILWGDKTPVYMAEIPLLARLFPQARFVHLLRDPRDCALSTAKAWGNSPLRTAQEWADRVRACRAAGAALGPSRYLELRYEDLTSDVRGHLGRIFDFLGLPTPADAGSFLRVPENYGDARGRTEVVADNTRKWQQEMPLAQRRRIEAITADLLADLGYPREFPELSVRRLSPVAYTAYRGRDALRQLAFRARAEGGWLRGLRFLLAR